MRVSSEPWQRGNDASFIQLSRTAIQALDNKAMSASENLRNWFSEMLPTPRLRAGATGTARRPVRRVILFGQHPNPTSDYYFSARLAAPGMPEYQVVDIRDSDFRALDPEGAFVIFCRYASEHTLDWIDRSAEQLAGVGLFIDDNIPAVISSSESSIPYKFKLFTKALWPLRRLNRLLDIVWVSTPRLAQEVPEARPRILSPAPAFALWKNPLVDMEKSEKRSVHLAFHATGIHVQEHRFLQPVIREILAARQTVSFEVFADARTAPLWKGIDRATIRQPLPWRDYLKEGVNRRIDIMLVPMSASLVNDCRSSTKRIDVARAGAAGVFSISEAYGGPDAGGEIRIPNIRAVWQEAILNLIDDPVTRFSVANATRAIVEQMSRQAEDGLNFGRLDA